MSKTVNLTFYQDVKNLIEQLIGSVAKTNRNIQMLILSGCLNSVTNSGSSGLNNLMPFSILSDKYSSYIGFTEDEVKKILFDAGIPEQMEVVRDWYEGYIFGNTL